jgi:cytochrome c oxidase cbb3-type subunit 3
MLLLAIGCKREQRVFDPGSSGAQVADGTALNEVHAGASSPMPDVSKYESSAYAVAEGKRLYSAYNCVGCHAQGGGAIGPALMDSVWIYGSHPKQIYSDIVQGRPKWYAKLRRQASRLPGLGTRRVRALDERPTSQ